MSEANPYKLYKPMYDKIKSCMNPEYYKQTVEQFGKEPAKPGEYAPFVEAYLLIDRDDRNAEARSKVQGPNVSKITKDPIGYSKEYYATIGKYPPKFFTDVVREQVKVDITCDLDCKRKWIKYEPPSVIDELESMKGKTEKDSQKQPKKIQVKERS